MARMVIIKLSRDVALHLQQGLADLNCWVRGFGTAVRLNGQTELEPMGISEIRDLNIILKGALEDYAKRGEDRDPINVALCKVWTAAYKVGEAAPKGSDAQKVAFYLHNVAVNIDLAGLGRPPIEAVWPLPTPEPEPEF